MNNATEIINGFVQDLRRGTILIGVLSQLNEPQYGYSLVAKMDKKGMSIDPGTLYPLLRRLEKQDLLDSQWETKNTRPRKYYLLSPFGREVYEQLCIEWKKMISGVEHLIEPELKIKSEQEETVSPS